MPEKRNKYDAEFREGAVRIVEESRKPIAQVARDLGVNEDVGELGEPGPRRPGGSRRAGQGRLRGTAAASR